MIRSHTKKKKAKVLWDYGFKTPLSLMNKMNIPQCSAELYVSDFRRGENGDGKNVLQEKRQLKAMQKSEKWLKKLKAGSMQAL